MLTAKTIETASWPEMSGDPAFTGRQRRLIGISAVMLGLIFLLARTAGHPSPLAAVLMVVAWVLMPTLLILGLRWPRARYLLTVPATMESIALLVVAVGFDGSALGQLGWWLLALGVLTGAGLGGWFWYRWLPVPAALSPPLSAGRWALISVHAGLVIAGMTLAVVGAA